MKTILDLLSKIQIKRDPWLVLLAIVLSVGCGVLVTKQFMTSKEAFFFLGGVFALPSFFGKKDGTSVKDDDTAPPSGPRPRERGDTPLGPPPAARVMLSLGAIALVWSIAIVTTPGCALFQGQDAKSVTKTSLTVLQKACIIANAAFPKSKVAEVCGIAGPLLDLLDDELLSARSAGVLPHRSYPVTCETTDTGIICVRPYVEPLDAGAH